MNAWTPFVPQIESTKSMEPGQRAFDDPARASQSAAVRTAAFRQLAGDPTSLEFVAMRLRVVPAVALHESWLPQRPTRAAAQHRNAIDEWQQLGHVVPVRRREARDDRNPVRVGKNMMFRPGLTAIGRVRSSFFPPRSARSEALSTTARARSSRPRRRNSVSKTRWSRFQTPARCTARADANTCCRTRSPSPSEAFSRGSRCGARTESRSTRRGRESASDRRAGGCAAAVWATGVRSVSISRRRQASGSCLTASLSVRRPYQVTRRSTRGRSVNFATHSKELRN